MLELITKIDKHWDKLSIWEQLSTLAEVGIEAGLSDNVKWDNLKPSTHTLLNAKPVQRQICFLINTFH